MSWVSDFAALQQSSRWDDEPVQPRYVAGVDLGQSRDFTAICVVRKNRDVLPKPTYDLVHLERCRNVPYPKIITQVSELMVRIDAMRPRVELELVIDATGVGAAVADLFRDADLPGDFTAVVIHGGDTVTTEGDIARVPKRLLAGIVQVMLQTRRLGISEHLPLQSVLVQELSNFKAKINSRGHTSFEAGDDWRDSAHDDLVLAVALALWRGENESSGWGFPSSEVMDVLREMGV